MSIFKKIIIIIIIIIPEVVCRGKMYISLASEATSDHGTLLLLIRVLLGAVVVLYTDSAFLSKMTSDDGKEESVFGPKGLIGRN
jgi:hypothetical protein